MIIHFAPGGRLGNQLFEVACIESLRNPDEIIISTKLKEAKTLVRGLRRYFNSDGWLLTNLVDHFAKPILISFAVKYRLFGAIIERKNGILKKNGLFPVTYVEGYFQSEEMFLSKSRFSFKIRSAFLDAARTALAQSAGRTAIFVHVRRGDYLTFSSTEHANPLLPEAYYRAAMNRMEGSIAAPFYFFVGDDPVWCEKTFHHIKNKFVSRASPLEDLALMSLCAGGICSNSTFAWWGAYMSGRGAPLLAPKYWMRWRIGVWHPPGIKSSIFDYLDVRDLVDTETRSSAKGRRDLQK